MRGLKNTLVQTQDPTVNTLRLNRILINQIRISAAWILLAAQSILLGTAKTKAAVPPFALQPHTHSAETRILTQLLPSYQYDRWDATFAMPTQHSYVAAALHPQGSIYNTLPVTTLWPNTHARFRTTAGTHHHHPSFQDRKPNRLLWEYPFGSFRCKLYRRRYDPKRRMTPFDE